MNADEVTQTTTPAGENPPPIARPRVEVSARTPARRFALLVFLLSPLAVLAFLCVLIAISIQKEPAMDAPPVGAGAGETGMLNDHLTKERQRQRALSGEPEQGEPEGSPPDSAAAPGN